MTARFSEIAGGVRRILAFLNAVVSELLQRNLLAYSALLNLCRINLARRPRFDPLLEKTNQLVLVACETGQTMSEMHAAHEQTEAQVGHGQVGRTLEMRKEIARLLLQLLGGSGGEHHQIGRRLDRRSLDRRGLFNDQMRVGAAEPERADGRSAHSVAHRRPIPATGY